MAFKVTFDGHELTKYLTVTAEFQRNIGSNRETTLQKLGNASGKKFISQTSDEASFSMPFVMQDNLIEKRRALAGILNVKEPKPLIFSDEPNVVYYAVPTGNIDLTETSFMGKGTITWLVPDGVGHARTIKSFEARLNAKGILEAEILNEGTAEVPVSYRIKHNHENGYVGIVSPHGAIQVGKIHEVDGEEYLANEVLIKDDSFINWQDDTNINGENPNKLANGKLAEKQVEGANCLYLAESGSGSNFHGGMRTVTLPNDSAGKSGSKNFYCYFNSWFETGLMGQTGCVNVNFLTKNNQLICSYIIEKYDTNGNTAQVCMKVGGNSGAIYKTIHFTPSYWDFDNPFNGRRGHTDLRKTGDYIECYWWGSHFGIYEPSIRDLECHKIQVFIGQYGSQNISNQFVTHAYLRNLTFQKMNVEKWRDVPNRYAQGTELFYDGETGVLYKDGLNALGDVIKGSQNFKVPPGRTLVQFYHSSFSNPLPSCSVEIKEAWL